MTKFEVKVWPEAVGVGFAKKYVTFARNKREAGESMIQLRRNEIGDVDNQITLLATIRTVRGE